MLPWAPNGPLTEARNAALRDTPRHPRETWRLDEGVALCRARFASSSPASLVGVTRINRTMAPKFTELCVGILNGRET